MDTDFARYDDLVHAIYDAALQPANWPDVVRRIAEVCASPQAMLFTVAHTTAQGGFTFAHNIPQLAFDRWASLDVDARDDPFLRALTAKGMLIEGVAVNGDDVVPHEELLATNFYKQWWEPIGIARLCTGVVFDGTDAHKLPASLSLYRSLNDPPFESEDVEIVRRLLAHLSRALGVMFHLRDRQLEVAASLAALDRLPASVVLLDAWKNVQFANAAAHDLFRRVETVVLRQHDGTTRRLALHPRLSSHEAAFQRSLTQALQPLERDVAEHFSRALLLPCPDGRPTCVVHVAPLPMSHAFSAGNSGARAIVFLYDLHSAASVPEELLREMFDMTAAEARAALQVVQGGSVEEMAQRLSVSANTFKTQLQMAYAKSNTHRQVDLLKLLLSLAEH